jgi:hypothetical protein
LLLKSNGMLLNAKSLFPPVWILVNALLVVALMGAIWFGVEEFHVRQYLKGFSTAIVPAAIPPQEKVEIILAWTRNGPRRAVTAHAEVPTEREVQDSMNYLDLMAVCGGATNAFLYLARSAGVETRRLLLLSPEGTTKHVVAEVHLDGRWVIADPTYGVLMKDLQGNLLTRKDLQSPELLKEATSPLPDYRPEYTYESCAHVRPAVLPFRGAGLHQVAVWFFPNQEQYLDWSLLLERRSFLYLSISACSLLLLSLIRSMLAWVADHYLYIPRFHLLANLRHAAISFFRTPE